MRTTHALFAALLFAGTATACPPDCASRLTGQWQSDANASMAYNRANAKLAPKQDEFLASLIGKMTLTFDGDNVREAMPDTQVNVNGKTIPFAGFNSTNRYKVLFCSPRMVVVQSPEPVSGEETAATMYFVGNDEMWVYVGNNDPAVPDLHVREYFKRITE
jgi:hypothetical protein